MIDWEHLEISITRQCELLGASRSSIYYEPVKESEENLKLKRLIDAYYTEHPAEGYRKHTEVLRNLGFLVNSKKVRRLMAEQGIQAIYPKKRTSIGNAQHKKYPYLLSDFKIERPNQVWSTDITYIRLEKGFVYLVAIIDWYSRYVLSWRLSNTMDMRFCKEALEEALTKGKPEIFNTDQGSQFTSNEFTECLEMAGIRISMDGKGRCYDNIFVERLWRSLKWEEVYLKDYKDPVEAYQGIKKYFRHYNDKRPHQSLEYKTPEEIHYNLIDKNGKVA